ncbi:COX assembly mitochondrial protein 2 homolog [Clavelina lepadiformis]|uniref:COX assembly mitochondrial protein n=1 Tax=Clavelina lepadiformis TaxID=159417 RepID=A0ABP0GWV2_CLALP
MPQSTAPNLHTPTCNRLVQEYHDCVAKHRYKKFIGACNDENARMQACFKEERRRNRKVNQEKANLKKEKTDEYLKWRKEMGYDKI